MCACKIENGSNARTRTRHARLKDIAERAGISKAAVSFALSIPQVSEKTRRKIRALANKFGYKPNPIVRR
ncbi:MAG: LacI family DNA-binding transcriptional regulator [Bacilli bacterium]